MNNNLFDVNSPIAQIRFSDSTLMFNVDGNKVTANITFGEDNEVSTEDAFVDGNFLEVIKKQLNNIDYFIKYFDNDAKKDMTFTTFDNTYSISNKSLLELIKE